MLRKEVIVDADSHWTEVWKKENVTSWTRKHAPKQDIHFSFICKRCLFIKFTHMHISLILQAWPPFVFAFTDISFWICTRILINSKVGTWCVRDLAYWQKLATSGEASVLAGGLSVLVFGYHKCWDIFAATLTAFAMTHMESHRQTCNKIGHLWISVFVSPFLAGCNPEIMSVCEVAVYFLSCFNHYYILY